MERRQFRRRCTAALTAGALALTIAPALATMAAAEAPSDTAGGAPASGASESALVAVLAPDAASVDRLLAEGYDLTEYTKPLASGVEVHLVATPEELATLKAQGFNLLETIQSAADVDANRAERNATLAAVSASEQAADTLTVLRSEWFTSTEGQRFLNVEIRATDTSAANALTLQWDSGPGTAMGSGGSATMQRFTDAGQYMYHRVSAPINVGEIPSKLSVSSTRGGTVTAPVTEWLGAPRKAPSPHYASDFVDHYMDPTEVYARIQSLAKEFPSIAEIVDLPNKTNGYRRKAQALVGPASAAGFYVTSKAWGHEGGNDLGITLKNPGAANAPLSVSVADKLITVSLATNGSGAVTSTAAQVVGAVNATPAAANLVTAAPYRTTGGTGLASAVAATKLSDNLKAPASVSRDPFQMQALRIGKARNGSKTGVLLYCQEHAREWVTPLVCVETAERLLRNYRNDPTTKKLVDNLDIFIVPSVNPDGGHYSFYDNASQRRNMTNYCPAANGDPNSRNSWGVDINRNFSVGSVYDGYNGGSTSCTSDTFAGPSELSEPEARNEVWLAQTFPNIKFAMNTHSYGGYFMWPPGAYKTAGRQLLPTVDLGTEDFFWGASGHILSAVQQWRGTAIWPGRTGPVTDVLYSAAGNSADELWYNYGIIGWDFEVGADKWNSTTKRFTAVGFQPDFAEGHEEAMEFANGQIGILEVALAHQSDTRPPKSTLQVTKQEPGSTSFTISVDEPGTVYYTLDGSRPTFESPKLKSSGMREGAESITLRSSTEVRWFSVDIAGNVESRYSPAGKAQNFNKQIVTVK
ncbi:MAG: M14 family metallopeptidase [Intrasporangium sp.]|uniref:M14 family metallopeptidase n=1 Tax=Intrasporangium sp. TaxID=1925024 RepID=UPI003F823934